MKKVFLFVKGMLIIATLTFFMLFLSGIDSIVENGVTTQWLAIGIIIFEICYISVDKEDIILMFRYFNRFFKL